MYVANLMTEPGESAGLDLETHVASLQAFGGLGLAAVIANDARLPAAVLHRYLETELGLPIFVQNDITAAAGGESLFGTARQLQDFFAALGLPVAGFVREAQVYRHLAAHGLTLFDVRPRQVERELAPWQSVLAWVDG